MPKQDESKVIKRTVAINPMVDKYVRWTWSMLIEEGYDATYSSTLNGLVVAAMSEIMSRGLSRKSNDLFWDFAENPEAIAQLNLEDHLAEIRKSYQVIKKTDK